MVYVRSAGATNYNERTIWYRNNILVIKKTLKITIALAVAFLTIIVWRNSHILLRFTSIQFAMIIAIPILAGWYTFSLPFLGIRKIRQTGWLKPFIIGLTWAGWVTIIPLLTRQVQTAKPEVEYLSSLFLFLQNFFFFSINAILFDIKDYESDYRRRLNTFPVILGIKTTFRRVVLPASVLNIIGLTLFQYQEGFTGKQSTVQFIPYLLLLCTVANYSRQRSVLYYLVAVDGLVFVKALSGISSIIFFKR
jgi:4-hydroxybenzoate polyprenyltransferase